MSDQTVRGVIQDALATASPEALAMEVRRGDDVIICASCEEHKEITVEPLRHREPAHPAGLVLTVAQLLQWALDENWSCLSRAVSTSEAVRVRFNAVLDCVETEETQHANG